jgi:penicillin-binding protein 1C
MAIGSGKIKFRRMLKITVLLLSLILVIEYIFCLPERLFTDPASTVIEDKDGVLIGAKIATDGQWRFPYNDHVPGKFKDAILQFEDRYFFYHPGVNLVSLFRAAITNIKSGEIVRGGSTLTMQVIRLSRKGKPRTIFEKMIEMVLATRLEIKYSKSTILALYAANAPFGGNVVGLDAASWRYYGRPPDELSWAEAATLAVLPNAPSLIYPGKNQEKLVVKRNHLIDRLSGKGIIDPVSSSLAKMEDLPGKPLPLEQPAPHLLERICKEMPGRRVKTTIDYNLQKTISEIVEIHHQELKFNEIHNAAAIVIEVETGNVLAYVGNTKKSGETSHGNDVDIIIASRSSGSILKPLLYSAMLNACEILPNTLIPDIPTQFTGLTPNNFDRTFSGAVPAGKALYRSLNVPAVRMLQQFGVQHFYDKLIDCGFTTLTKPPDHYGLSLILGGAETTLWDLVTAYSGLTRTLNHFAGNSGLYDLEDWHQAVYVNKKQESDDSAHKKKSLEKHGIISTASVWFTFKAMIEVSRPQDYTGWRTYSSSNKIAWKTGTSFGFRDAWALGTTPEFIVAVWVGNADGEGRSGITGISAAAPILFDIFNVLPETSWFEPPYDHMTRIAVCRQSGHRVNQYCETVDTVWIPVSGIKTPPCPYHHLIHLDKTRQFRVTDDCYDPLEMTHQSWFILPPVMEWFYKRGNPLYLSLPPLYAGCGTGSSVNPMEFIYPGENNRLYLPVDLDGTLGSIILEVAHRNSNSTIYWHIDNEFIGMTGGIHQISVQPSFGKHRVTVIDESGRSVSKDIEILQSVKK